MPNYSMMHSKAAMETSDGGWQCHRKWPPMWDLRQQKKCCRKVFYGLYFHSLHHC